MESCEDDYVDYNVFNFGDYFEKKKGCCDRIDVEQPPNDGQVYCNLTWDTWDCWNWTRAGDIATQNCPSWILGSDKASFASKPCMPDGSWFVRPDNNQTWTDYTDCECPEEKHKSSLYMFYAGYVVSSVSSAIALFIFCHFKSLGCPRVTIHKNLFVSFILCGICNLVWHLIMLLKHQALCKAVSVLVTYFTVSNYLWMLSEGLYLHTVIVVAVFSENHNLLFYYFVGWVAPIIPTVVYTGLNIVNKFEDCWTGNWTAWILGMSYLLVTAVNLGFLLNIVRVLVTKLRAIQSQGTTRRNYAKAVRATMILLPLMGIPWIILPARPVCSVATIVYDYINYFLIAWQGFFVACIFCFFNGEVKMQIRRKWIPDNWKKRRGSDFRFRNTTVTVMTEAVSTTPRQSLNINTEKEGETLLTERHLPNGNTHFDENDGSYPSVNYRALKTKSDNFTDINKNVTDQDSSDPFVSDNQEDRETTPV